MVMVVLVVVTKWMMVTANCDGDIGNGYGDGSDGAKVILKTAFVMVVGVL